MSLSWIYKPGLLIQEKWGTIGESPVESYGDARYLMHLPHEEMLRDVELFSLEKTEGNLSNVYKYLIGGSQVDGSVLFSVVPSNRIWGKWAQAGTQEVSYEHDEKLVYFEGYSALEQAA